MEPIAMLSADPLDILFENRNKAYGAYPLRRYYVQRLYTALAVMTSVVVVLCALTLFHPGTTVPFVPTAPDTHLIDLGGREQVKPEIKTVHPQTRKMVNTAIITNPLIVTALKQPTPMATVEELKVSAIGSEKTAGGPDEGTGGSGGNENGTGTTLQADSAVAEPAVFNLAEVMPEFPGGAEALKRFLIKNLRMPDTELEAGAKVRVIARFIVGPDGKVRDIEIIQSGDAPFNAEVKRVIAKMPDWKPGRQHQHAVAVFYSLPVNFING